MGNRVVQEPSCPFYHGRETLFRVVVDFPGPPGFSTPSTRVWNHIETRRRIDVGRAWVDHHGRKLGSSNEPFPESCPTGARSMVALRERGTRNRGNLEKMEFFMILFG